MADSETSDMRRLIELMDDFSHAMLVTIREPELRSRPMALGEVGEQGQIRFVTRDDTPKLAELEEHPQVNVAMQGVDCFLSISGRARLTKDKALKERLLAKGGGLWFSAGEDDPHLIVIEVVPTHAEYWNEGAEGVVETVIGRALQAVGVDEGGSSSAGDDEHGEVDFTHPNR